MTKQMKKYGLTVLCGLMAVCFVSGGAVAASGDQYKGHQYYRGWMNPQTEQLADAASVNVYSINSTSQSFKQNPAPETKGAQYQGHQYYRGQLVD